MNFGVFRIKIKPPGHGAVGLQPNEPPRRQEIAHGMHYTKDGAWNFRPRRARRARSIQGKRSWRHSRRWAAVTTRARESRKGIMADSTSLTSLHHGNHRGHRGHRDNAGSRKKRKRLKKGGEGCEVSAGKRPLAHTTSVHALWGAWGTSFVRQAQMPRMSTSGASASSMGA